MKDKSIEIFEKSILQIEMFNEIINRQNILLNSAANRLSKAIVSSNLFNLTNQMNDIVFSLPHINTIEWEKLSLLSSEIVQSFSNISSLDDFFTEHIQKFTESLSIFEKLLTTHLAAITLSALDLSSLGIFEKLNKLIEQQNESAEAFKAAGWTISPSMSNVLQKKVVQLHQKSKTRYVSQLIIGYYHKSRFEILKNTVDSWKLNPLYSPRMHIFNAALTAHCEGNYILSVPTLFSQIEGILNEYVKVNQLEARLGKIEKVYNAVIGDLDDYPIKSWVIANTLLYQLQTNTYTYTDFETEFRKSANNRKTTRHTVLHGISTNYDKPIHSLKAFTLLDALSSLKILNNEKMLTRINQS